MSRTVRSKIAGQKFWRHPKTQGEKRLYFSAKEGGLSIRAKRNPKRLVDSYDDIPVAAMKEIVSTKINIGD